MSKTGRLILLVLTAVFLIAAIVAALPGNSPYKLPAIVVISILGVGAALLQFAQTGYFQRILRAPPVNAKRITSEQLLVQLADRGLLLRAEAAGHQPIYELDTDYWTNLELDFAKLAEDPDSLDLISARVLKELRLEKDSFYVIEPLDIEQSASDVRRVLEAIRQRICRYPFIRATNIHRYRNVALLVGTYTPDARSFLFEEGRQVASAIFLIGPDADYLKARFKGLPFRSYSLISADTLRQVDTATRRAMVWYS